MPCSMSSLALCSRGNPEITGLWNPSLVWAGRDLTAHPIPWAWTPSTRPALRLSECLTLIGEIRVGKKYCPKDPGRELFPEHVQILQRETSSEPRVCVKAEFGIRALNENWRLSAESGSSWWSLGKPRWGCVGIRDPGKGLRCGFGVLLCSPWHC